jgi:hypothetical protein
MIVDELASVTSSMRVILGDAHIIRVPWHLWPEEKTEFTWSEREWGATNKIAPRTSDGEVERELDWREIALPYDDLIIASTLSDPCVWRINVADVGVGDRSIAVAVFLRLQSGRWTCIPFNFVRTAEGRLGTCPWRTLTTPEKQRSIQWYEELLKACGYEDLKDISIAQHAQTVLQTVWSDVVGHDEPNIDRGNVSIALTATAALLSCRNVIQEVVEPSPEIQLARKRRGKLPLYRHHILKVKLAKTHSPDGKHYSGETVAVHWVRGHFKRYTEENKLFGKHTGLYWWQPYVAGTAERFVDKSYELVL